MFTSIEAPCQEFGLDPSDTVEALLKQLTLRRTLTHSDKTGGEFASEAANNNFIRLTEAIEYLRKPATADLALLKNSELDKFAATVASLQLTVERLRLDNSPSTKSESAVKKDISNSYRASLLGSATLATCSAAILAFSGKLSSNPVLSPLASNEAVRIFILMSLLISGLAFIYCWVNEQRLKHLAEFLLSDDGLATVIYWCVNNGRDKEPKIELTKRTVARACSRYELDFCEGLRKQRTA